MNRLFKLLCCCLLLSPGVLRAQTAAPAKTADSTSARKFSQTYRYALYTEEMRRFYQADAFPLSLAERGRQSATSLRGMPPGMVGYRMGEQLLENPISGFWNEQLLPVYRFGQKRGGSGFGQTRFTPHPAAGEKPITDLTFFQDFISGFSYLDINFRARVNETDFFELAGNNFVRDGTKPFLQSRINVNTYQVRYHRRLGGKLHLDGNYWQLRHRYSLPPENPDFVSSRDKFKQVRHLFWASFSTRLSESDSLIITPSYSDLDDNYWQVGNRLRRIQARWAQVRGLLLHDTGSGTAGIRFNAAFLHSRAYQIWEKRNEWNAGGTAFLQRQSGSFRYEVEAGLTGQQDAGLSAVGNLKWQWTPPRRSYSLGIELFSRARPLPLLWRALKSDSIPAANGDRFIQDRGAGFTLRKQLSETSEISVTPFYARTENYPVLQPTTNRWQFHTYSNRGFLFHLTGRLWKFGLENDFTYNKDYLRVFAPQFNNITKLQAPLTMFQGALKLRGTLVGHLIGNYRLIEYQRLISQYRLGDQTADPIFIADFLLEAKIQSATLYFVWENLLSQDYQIVAGQGEFFRFFRLGLHWRLFD